MSDLQIDLQLRILPENGEAWFYAQCSLDTCDWEIEADDHRTVLRAIGAHERDHNRPMMGYGVPDAT